MGQEYRGGNYHGMQTGKEYEISYLGTIKISDDYLKAYQEALLKDLRANPETGYLSYNTAMELIKKFQPGDKEAVTNPQRDFMRELRLSVLEKMNLSEEDEKKTDNLKSYTAVGSPLDIFHGVDAFLTFKDENKKKTAVVTIDISLRQKVQFKADICEYGEIPPPEEDEGEYLKRIEHLAEQVTERIQTQLAA